MLSHTGAVASILGVLIALIGFWITIRNVRRSRRAATRAERAAKEALESVRHFDTVQNLSEAISIVGEIQRLNRLKEWKVLLDRHSTFRDILVEVKGSAAKLNEQDKVAIQDGISQSKAMSHKIEVAVGKGEEPTNVLKNEQNFIGTG